MRIWFDITNSPHINFFALLIQELEKEGHEIVITSRPLANTIQLLELHRFDFEVIGIHYGKNIFRKIFGYPIRIGQLYSYLKHRLPDVAISHSSFHSPITSRLLGCCSIYLNDNEYAIGNIPSFIFADIIMIPEFLDIKKVRKQGASKKKIIQYPGVKEGIYLWNLQESMKGKGSKVKGDKPKIYIRPEPWTAQYYKGRLNFLDEVLLKIRAHAEIIILPRGEEQAKHYKENKFIGIKVSDKVYGLPEILQYCNLFIGAGGTMTREMAVLGVPTISVYQDALLDVDRYLLAIGQMVHKPDLTADFVLNYLRDRSRKPPRHDLLTKGREAYNLIKSELLNKK